MNVLMNLFMKFLRYHYNVQKIAADIWRISATFFETSRNVGWISLARRSLWNSQENQQTFAENFEYILWKFWKRFKILATNQFAIFCEATEETINRGSLEMTEEWFCRAWEILQNEHSFPKFLFDKAANELLQVRCWILCRFWWTGYE